MKKDNKEDLLIIAHHFIPFAPSYGQIARQLTMALHFSEEYNVHVIAAQGKKNYGYYGYDIDREFKISYVEDEKFLPINSNDIPTNSNKFFKIIFVFKQNSFIRAIKKISYMVINRIKSKFILDIYEYPVINKILKKAINTIRTNNISIIIIMTPPYSIQKLVYPLKKRFPNVKLILDYQDSWVVPALLSKRSISSLRARRIERKSLVYADKIVFNIPIMKQHYDEYYGIPGKTKLFMNGFDFNYLNTTIRIETNIKIENKLASNIVNIGYFGKIHIGNQDYFRDIRKFFDFFRESTHLFKEKFHLDIYGYFSGDYESWKKYVPFDYKGIVDYCNINIYMEKYDYLMLFHSDSARAEEVLTGKLMEYLYARIPIIVLGPTNMIEARKLIENNNLGVFIDIDDTADMKEKLQFLYDLKMTGEIKNHFNKEYDISQFDRKIINEHYLTFIKEHCSPDITQIKSNS
jgi:hypothetical protein